MTPAAMARIHARAFPHDRSWSEDEFKALIAGPHVSTYATPQGFALIRAVAGEAELLTLAVDPDHHRQGHARKLMRIWMSAADADEAFLEVAADNAPAISLYAAHGFAPAGRRTGYYTRKDTAPVDALLMRATLTRGHEA
ncbi:GNAT family N-acetyltransferase [Sulfitobacter sabulilitoris]|nr:GNAT family N-acetyltransferase [Sulfitobacter sabulilitoris]